MKRTDPDGEYRETEPIRNFPVLRLDPELAPGAFRMLTAEEKKALADCR